MKGTVAPPSRRSTAALTWAGRTLSSAASCIRILSTLGYQGVWEVEEARSLPQGPGASRQAGSATIEVCAEPFAAMALIPYFVPKSVLFNLDPETAHDLTIGALARLQNTPLACLWAENRVQDPGAPAGGPFPHRGGGGRGPGQESRG